MKTCGIRLTATAPESEILGADPFYQKWFDNLAPSQQTKLVGRLIRAGLASDYEIGDKTTISCH
jgi:hypothetical protein